MHEEQVMVIGMGEEYSAAYECMCALDNAGKNTENIRERERVRQTDRQAEVKIHIERERERERERDRQTET